MDKGLVSIITPCYNGAKYVAETIESVINQTYKKWEMIIVDDGSKDKSAEIIKTYVNKDSRIKYIYQNNAGSAAARNNGIRRAQGQYIALLDADDVWHKDFLEKQIAFIKKNNAVCVYCSYSKIDDHSRSILRPTISKGIITTKDMKVMNQIIDFVFLNNRDFIKRRNKRLHEMWPIIQPYLSITNKFRD